MVIVPSLCAGQELTGAPANPKYKYSTQMPPGVASPDKVETRLGTLNFFDGFPDQATADTLYDNLDFQRAVQAFLFAIPAVSQAANRDAFKSFGPPNTFVPIFEQLQDARAIILTANNNTVYSWLWLELIDGPTVLEVPPKVLGTANDMWQQWVVDIGITGPDKGEGGKYLFLPPGYKGDVPEGYYVVHSPTFSLWIPWRSFLVDGDPEPGVDLVKKYTKIYPLADAAKTHPPLKFVNMTGKPFNTVYPTDYRFWKLLNQVVQEEPKDSLDQIRLGYFQSIGIEKGKPFEPDERMKKILTEAVAVGNATARALTFRPRLEEVYYYPDRKWFTSFPGGSYEFLTQPGVRNLDGRVLFHYYATGVTPAMAMKMVGVGSQYAAATTDSAGRPLDGSKTYKIHLPPGIPARNFWSFVVYDNQTRSMLQTDQQYPSISSLKEDVVINKDGSVDVWFAPTAPKGHESNWVQTVPGKGWNSLLRLYGPEQAWFDKSWKPGDFELVE